MRFKNLFLVVLTLMLLVPSTSQAQWNPWCALIGTCGDQPTKPVVDPEQQRLDQEFELVFGPAPTLAQYGSLRPFQAAKVGYEQNRKFFGGLIDVPAGAEKALAYYESMGVPQPLFYLFKGEERAMFVLPPDPEEGMSWRNPEGKLFVKHRVYVTDTAANATGGFVYRNILNWQLEAVKRGACVERLHPYLDIEKVTTKNKENCGQEE